MSLSKQLYIIISMIFFIIFAGNFIISINNTKEYLEIESITKAQDTATSLKVRITPLIHDKKDPEIESIIKAIANRGFYKEIRLEDIIISFDEKDLINNSIELSSDNNWKISNVTINPKFGKIEEMKSTDKFESELERLNNEAFEIDDTSPKTKQYILKPSNNFIEGKEYKISFDATLNKQTIPATATMILNKTLVKEFREEKFSYVPQWFINLIHINLEEQSSNISDGWKTVATIYVSANAGDAYAKLYEQAQSAIVYSLIAFLVSILFLFFFLKLILKPLKNIEKLAINIAAGQFGKVELPYTTDIRNVAIAMNDMSSKIETIIRKLNSNIENMTKKISQDGLTKLELRQTFETDMKNMFISKTNGFVFSLKIEALGEFAKNRSNNEVDQFIKDFANILVKSADECRLNIKAYRFFGSEFAIIAKNVKKEDITDITKYLKEKFEKLNKEIKLTNISNIGVTMFNQIGTIPEMLSAATEARESAKQIGPNEAFVRDESDLARDMEAWRELIFDIIDNKTFKVGYIGDAYTLNNEKEKTLIMQEAFTSTFDKDNNPIPIGTFISIAEKYEKVIDFDKAVINSVINHIKNSNLTHSISINLSLDSIIDINFISWLEKVLTNNTSIASNLVFSITAYGVAKDIDKFKEFSKIVNSYNGKIIVKRFESKFIPLESIKDLNLDFIRLARDYTNGISSNSGKYAFVESMQDLCNLINIKLLAENVKEDEDLEKVKEIGLFAASR